MGSGNMSGVTIDRETAMPNFAQFWLAISDGKRRLPTQTNCNDQLVAHQRQGTYLHVQHVLGVPHLPSVASVTARHLYVDDLGASCRTQYPCLCMQIPRSRSREEERGRRQGPRGDNKSQAAERLRA